MRRVRGWVKRGKTSATARRTAAAPGLRALLPDLLVILTLLAMIWASIWVNLARERDNALDVARRTADNAAGAAEQVISRTVEAVDQHILFVRDAFRRDRLGFSLDFLRESRAPGRPTLQIAIIDAAGRLVATDRGPAPPTDLSDRAHFRAHLGDAPDLLFISVPVLGRESGRWSVQFTRRLVDENGRFAGVVVGSLDPNWLTHLHGTLDVGRGVLTLMGRDGVVRARAPQAPGALGSDMRGTPLFDAVMRSDRGSLFTVSPLDGTERLVAFRHVADYPLIVMAGRDAADIYAGFEAFRLRALAAGAALTALVLLAGWLLIRHKRQQLGSQRALSDAVENISQGLIMVDAQGRVPVLNRRVAELLGLPAALLAGRPSFAAIRRWQIESGEFGAPGALPTGTSGPVDEMLPAPRTSGSRSSVYERVRPDGTVLEVRTRHLENGGAVRTYADITERRRAEERVLFLAHHDALTGLANRFALRDRLERALAETAPKRANGVAVLALDLDRFKAVNDAMGHAAGDALLAQVADRLRGCARAADTVARLGGDEFVVMQPGATLGDAETVARRVVAALSEPFLLDGQEARVGTSVGIALAPPAAPEADALLRDADTALYRAKAEGRGTIRVFEPGMGARRRARRRMEHELRRALEEPEGTGGLVLHFQPIFERRGRRVAACEALLRWTHPERGAIPPGEFIAVAEESGLIQPLGRWALRAACAAAASWPGQPRVAVNVSPAQLRAGDLAELVAGTLRDTGLPARRLELEVTEGLLIQDADGALAAIRALKAQGVGVALDDFGTGYSSLAYLHRFPFDRVKVDRSFVAALEADEGARAIIRAILGMSASLGLAVTAEGVETPGQREFLDAHGCDELQGFLLARPMPAAELAALLDREARNGEQAAA